MEWWDTNSTLRGEHIFSADFDATMIAYCIGEAKWDYENGDKDPDIKKPYKFSHIEWVAWEDMGYTYFNDMKNIRGVTLTYVIRKIPEPSGIVINREQYIIQHSPL